MRVPLFLFLAPSCNKLFKVTENALCFICTTEASSVQLMQLSRLNSL